MKRNDVKLLLFLISTGFVLTIAGCTVKAVGDPDRPIIIQAHITVDIKGLENTATDIEDYVSGGKTKEDLTAN